MFQWKVNLGDFIIVSLFSTLGISTVAVFANQLEPEKYEYWSKTFVLVYFLVICMWPRLEPYFALLEKFKRLRFTSKWYRNLPYVKLILVFIKTFLNYLWLNCEFKSFIKVNFGLNKEKWSCWENVTRVNSKYGPQQWSPKSKFSSLNQYRFWTYLVSFTKTNFKPMNG